MNNEDKIYALLEKIYTELQDTKNELKNEIQENRKAITELETNIKELKQGQELIKDHIDQLDSKNANRHVEAFSKLNNIEKDIKFIKHKLHQTEEDVFDIKDYLKIIK